MAVYSPNTHTDIWKYMLKRVACVAYCPKSAAQRVLYQSHGLIWESITDCPKSVAQRVLKINALG